MDQAQSQILSLGTSESVICFFELFKIEDDFGRCDFVQRNVWSQSTYRVWPCFLYGFSHRSTRRIALKREYLDAANVVEHQATAPAAGMRRIWRA